MHRLETEQLVVGSPAHTMFDDASAGSLQLYAAIVFVTYAGGCGFISRATGCKIAACYAGIAYLALRCLGSFDVTSDVAAQLVRLLAFQTYLALFCSMLYGRDAMTFLTNWCLWFHVQYFAVGATADPALDRVAGVAHAAGFFAAYSVYFGFLVAAACGGCVPNDVLVRARKEPATEFGVSSFIGWVHSSPTLFYVLDAMLARDHLRRIYAGRVLGTMAAGLAIFFSVGQFWECLHPNTREPGVPVALSQDDDAPLAGSTSTARRRRCGGSAARPSAAGSASARRSSSAGAKGASRRATTSRFPGSSNMAASRAPSSPRARSTASCSLISASTGSSSGDSFI